MWRTRCRSAPRASPQAEEIEALLNIYDADGSGTLDKEEFVRMMYEFIQNREPPSSEEEEDVPEEEKPLGPDEDGADDSLFGAI